MSMSCRALFLLVSLAISMESLAQEQKRFYIEGLIGSGIDKLEASKNYAGASGWVSPTSPTGRMGDVSNDSDTSLGIKIGYKYSDNIKLDLSFYSLGYGKTNWGTDFYSFNGTYDSNQAAPFVGELTSKVAFVSAYYNWNFNNQFKPYIGFGLGVSRNKFHAADEAGNATIENNTKTEFAYKLDIGSIYQISPAIALNFGASFIDVGGFKSGKQRRYNNGTLEAITPYKFSSDGLNPIYTVGVIYSF